MKGKKRLFTLKELLPDVIARISGDNVHDQIKLENVWQELIGREAKGVAFKGYKDGSVFIHVDSPARSYQLKLRKTELLRAFRQKCPEVKNIFFKTGKWK